MKKILITGAATPSALAIMAPDGIQKPVTYLFPVDFRRQQKPRKIVLSAFESSEFALSL